MQEDVVAGRIDPRKTAPTVRAEAAATAAGQRAEHHQDAQASTCSIVLPSRRHFSQCPNSRWIFEAGNFPST